jgi:hypothetical protein
MKTGSLIWVVTAAETEVQRFRTHLNFWIPACAGMTLVVDFAISVVMTIKGQF